MSFSISPSVKIREFDRTTVVPSIASTEAGFAGHFRWGPVDQRALITNESELVRTYQEPNSNTATDFFVAADVLAYSNQLFVTRVVDQTSNNQATNAHGNASNTAGLLIKNEDDYEENYESGISNVGDWVSRYPGELGNSLKVSVCPSSDAWKSTLSGNLDLTQDSTTVTGTGTAFDTEVTVGDILVLGSDFEERKVESVANATSLTLADAYTGNTATDNSVERRWEYFNDFDIAPGTSDYVSQRGGSNDELHIVVVDEEGKFTGIQNTLLERFEAVSFASDAKTENGTNNYYKTAVKNRSRYIYWAQHNSNNTNAGSQADNTSFSGDTVPQSISLVNGVDGNQPTNADYINGYNLFKNSEDVDISFLPTGGRNSTVVKHVINNIAEVRKDVIVTVSPERADVVNNDNYPGKQADDIVSYRNTLPSSSYAFMDSGWKYRYDKYNDVFRYVPLNGDTAGLMIRTDNIRDPWWSPAGYNRGSIKNVTKLAFNPNKAERDLLYKNGINPVITEPGQGTLLFGDKTMLSKPSAFDRINVRRLFIVTEKAIATAAKFSLFEFNDPVTRQQFKNLVEPYLRDVQGRRGLREFKVVVDETVNTEQVMANNEFKGQIYIVPNYSINFITLDFIAVRGNVEFNEVVGSL